VLGITTDSRHAAFDVGIEFATILQGARGNEDDFRRFRRQLTARLGSTGLNDHRPAFNRARNVQRASYGQVFTFVIEGVQFVRIEIDPAAAEFELTLGAYRTVHSVSQSPPFRPMARQVQ
jgi:hypothetical protein